MSSEKLPHQQEPDFSVNWDRAIFIDEVINEQLVRRLTPTILKLRQESTDPITVAINSPGGSLSSLDTLLGLLQGPTQFSSSGSVVTVVTDNAYSAAANLLALGNYSVAMQHSSILFHDVRFGEMEDVTPSKALIAAKSLQDENDRFALKLANRVIRRLIWIYIDFENEFDQINQNYPSLYKKYTEIIPNLPKPRHGARTIDIASFAIALFRYLSPSNESLIHKVISRLGTWTYLTKLSHSYPSYREKGSRKPGLLDGVRRFNKELNKTEIPEACEADLKLMITLLISGLKTEGMTFNQNIEEATRNFNLIQSMDDEKHRQSAVRLMLRNPNTFFEVDFASLNDDDKKAAISGAMPYAQMFWLFCVSLCRELFDGENILTPTDSQLLGLVDEVAGGGPVESRREYRFRRAAEKEKNDAATAKV